MLKKSLSIILATIIMLGILTGLPVTVTAQVSDIADGGINLVLAESGNPYSGGYANCTWTAWKCAFDDGYHLPDYSWGDAWQWYGSAQRDGYHCDKTSSAHSIIVYNYTSTNSYGHVAYVVDYNSANNMIYVKEGGYLGGYHEGWISAYDANLLGYIHLDGGLIEPTAPNINVCVNAPEVDISWNDVGAYGYYVYVENRDTQKIPYSNDLGRSFSVHLGLSEGHWRVYVMAMYSNNEIKSSSYDFDIKIESPNVSISVNLPTVDISWNDVGASSYYIYVQNSDTQNIPYSNNIGKNCFIHLGLSNGKWRVYVTAVYSEDLMKSTSVDFTIGDNVIPTVPPTEPTIIKLGDVDGDGEVTIIDATCVQRKLASIATAKFVEAAADADEDGELSIIDTTVIQRWLAQLPSNNNIGKPIK